MPKQAEVKKSYPAKKPALLAPFVTNVANCINENPNFPESPVSSQTLIESSGILSNAYSNRKNGLIAKEDLKMALANTINLLTTLIPYINSQANGDAQVIATAGFQATKTTKSKAIVPHAPKPPVLENTNGELSMKTQPVKGASSYCWLVFIGNPFPVGITNGQLNLTMQSNVIVVPAGSTRECVRGLTRTTEVTVQVLAQNTAGKSALSTPVSIGIA